MGRKSNPVIIKHFTRGEKLQDASNRYQYTCKQCGERFPKGRIESLHNHVTKKCTALSFNQKRDVVLQIHGIGVAAAAAAAAAAKDQSKVKTSQKARLPIPKPQNQDCARLNALAEVSHRRAAIQQSFTPFFFTENDAGVGPLVLDPALENEGLPSGFFSGVEDDESAGQNEITSSGLTSSTVISPAQKLLRRSAGNSMTTAPQSNFLLSSATSITQAASLSSIAASANARLAHSMIPNRPNPMQKNISLLISYPTASTINQQAPSWPLVATPIDQTCDIIQDDMMIEQQMAAAYPRLIAMNPSSHVNDVPVPSSKEPSQESSPPKPKVRAEFSEARKQEIKKMRQIGSCIRCRMLRKPCSENTPCAKCGVIDKPRNWKGFPCLRVKLVELYQGYMLGLYQTLSSRDVDAAISRIRFAPSSNRLLVKYFDNADQLELSALESGTNDSTTDPSLSVLSNGRRLVLKTVIVDNAANNLPTIFEKYVHKEAPHFLEQEASSVIKSVAMASYKHTQESDDELLQNVVELWMVTTMLSDPTIAWKISTSQNLPQGSLGFAYGPAPAAVPLDAQTDRQSYKLICSQLRSGLERLASKLSTHALNKFERRMFRTISSNQFETYLIAILLINCVERHSWIFHSKTKATTPAQWPIDQSPAASIAQAEQVTNVIAFMTKIRNLTPKITKDNASGVLKAEHTNDNDKYVQWFKEIGVTVDSLTQRQDAVFDTGNCSSLDLKYATTLLLP